MRGLSGKRLWSSPTPQLLANLIRSASWWRKERINLEPRSHINIGALTKLENNSKPGHSRKLINELIFIHFDTTSRHQGDKQRLLRSIRPAAKASKSSPSRQLLTFGTNGCDNASTLIRQRTHRIAQMPSISSRDYRASLQNGATNWPTNNGPKSSTTFNLIGNWLSETKTCL